MRDRGAADAVGLVLIAPVAVGLAVLVVLLGRGVDARAQVRSAAAAAAQAAALERDAGAAQRAASEAAAAMLVDVDACAAPSVAVDYPRPAVVGGDVAAGGIVRVTLRCTVSGRGLELVDGRSRTEVVTATASLDAFRAGEEP